MAWQPEVTGAILCDGVLAEALAPGEYEWGIVLHQHEAGVHECLMLCESDDWESYPVTLDIPMADNK